MKSEQQIVLPLTVIAIFPYNRICKQL